MGYPNPTTTGSFWQEALAWRQAITKVVMPRTLVFGLFALAVSALHQVAPWPSVEVTHVTYTGGVLVLLLVLRTNAGYDRWWEARKLWGGIVNQSRNLALKGLAYGPPDATWQDRFVRWSAAFSHVARRSLRDQRDAPELVDLLGAESAAEVQRAQHLPNHVALELARLLREARESGDLDGWAFQEVDRERAILIDHIGGCERILRTPLPRVHSIKLRRFIFLYLTALPFAIVSPAIWVAPLVTVLVAYPLLAVDQIGQELENPFSEARASHLPLDAICQTIEGNLLALIPRRA